MDLAIFQVFQVLDRHLHSFGIGHKVNCSKPSYLYIDSFIITSPPRIECAMVSYIQLSFIWLIYATVCNVINVGIRADNPRVEKAEQFFNVHSNCF